MRNERLTYYIGMRSGRRGFTLVEMLISLSIFSLVTAMAVANFRVGSQNDELRLAARLMATQIRRAQTLAIAGYSVHSCIGGTSGGQICTPGANDNCAGGGYCSRTVPPAWGIRISSVAGENREIVIFADLDNDKEFDRAEAVEYQSISPGPSVYVQSMTPHSVMALDVVFTPPRPTVSLNGSDSAGIATIILEHLHSEKQINVTVNRVTGFVSVD